jgi:hypothetical protein
MTICYEKHLKGESTKFKKYEKIDDDFDLFIFTVGWESRCVEILDYFSSNLKIKNALVLSFAKEDDKGYDPQYYVEIEQFIQKNRLKSEPLELKEDKYVEKKQSWLGDDKVPIRSKIIFDENIKQIFNKISNCLKDSGTALKIGFDISSCPRRYLLSILAFCIKMNVSKKITFFYSEGVYQKDSFDEDKYKFTLGRWVLTDLPMFKNRFEADLKTNYLISVGFESNRYRGIISDRSLKNVSFILPIPGYSEDYTYTMEEELKALKRERYITKSGDNFATVEAGDAIEVWETLKSPQFNKKNFQLVYLPFGPKPHILGMGLHAILNNTVVLYRLSIGGYKRTDVKPNGNLWRYEITNLLVSD